MTEESTTPELLPVFMSAEHVALINERLAQSAEVAEACSRISRPCDIAYLLQDTRANAPVHWSMHFGPDGAWLGLDPIDTPDVTLVGDYWKLIEASKRAREGGRRDDPDLDLKVVGDESIFETCGERFGLSQRISGMPVRWPE